MMERDDIIVRHFFIFFVECLYEVDVFRDRGDDDDISSDKILFTESFAEHLRIELQGIFDQPFRQRIGLDEFIGLIPVLDDTVVLVHLLQCTHSQVQCLYAMIESVLDLDRLTGIFCDIQQDEIIFLQIVPQEDEGMKRLWKDIDILYIKEIPIDGIHSIYRLLIEIYDI